MAKTKGITQNQARRIQVTIFLLLLLTSIILIAIYAKQRTANEIAEPITVENE